MNFPKTIIFSIILAATAFLCSLAAVYYESAAEKSRFMVAGNDEILKRQNLFQLDRAHALLRHEVTNSRIHSQVFFKENPNWISWQKEKVFFNAVATLEGDINHIKTLEESHFHNKKEVYDLIIDSENFIKQYKEDSKFNLLNRDEFSIKFSDLQILLKRYVELMRLRSDHRLKEINQYKEYATSLSSISTYLILTAFIFELFIFILIQFLEIRTERKIK